MNNRLRDLAEVHYGKSPNDVLSEDATVPVIGTGGVYGRASRSLFNGPAVVVARKGTLGNPQFIDEPFWPVDTTYAVLARSGVDTKWLYYSLAAFDLTKLNEATGVPSISRDWLYKVPLGATNFGLEELRKYLPADTPHVGPEARQAQVHMRQLHAARRWAP